MDIATKIIFQFLHTAVMDRRTDFMTATLCVRQKQKDSRGQWQKLVVVRFEIRLFKISNIYF